MKLKELPVGAFFRFPDDPRDTRRTVLGQGGPLVVVETWYATSRSEGTFLGELAVEPEQP